MEKMFKCVLILAAASLVCSIPPTTTLTSSEELIENIKINMVKNYLRERQAMSVLRDRTEEICPGYGDKLETALLKVQQCTDNIDEDSQTMCSGVQNYFEKCISPVVKMFEECLPERSQDLPSFLVKSVVKVAKELCRTDGEHIFELSNPCVRSHNYRTERCIRKVQSKLQQYSSKVPSKEDVCQFLNSFRGCLQSHLHSSCGHVKTREAFLDIYDAALESCQKDSMNEIELVEPEVY